MPHAISVEVDELADKVVRATIFVETESQKQIVVGKGGSVVKQIGTRARPEIEHLLGHTIFLELHGQGEAEVAARRGDARAPRHLMPLLALFDVDGTLFLTRRRRFPARPCGRRSKRTSASTFQRTPSSASPIPVRPRPDRAPRPPRRGPR